MRGQGKLREELAPPCGTAALSPLRSDRALTGLVRAGHDQHGGLALARRWPNPPTGICASRGRSEEHTSELQSLMRISYAVYCLKKRKTYISYYVIITYTTTSYK